MMGRPAPRGRRPAERKPARANRAQTTRAPPHTPGSQTPSTPSVFALPSKAIVSYPRASGRGCESTLEPAATRTGTVTSVTVNARAKTLGWLVPLLAASCSAPRVLPEPLASKPPAPDVFNRHGVGVRGGIVIVPTWILHRWVETQTNALCRGEKIGGFAEERGLLQTDGCNFYVGGEYTYRRSRIFDIVGAVGYQRAKLPEGYWLDKGRYRGTPETLLAADYTEVDLSLLTFEADFIARAPVVSNDNVEIGIGGGAGIGLGVVFGGVYQTGIGGSPNGYTPGQGASAGDTCQTPEDLADFNRCTPRYDLSLDPDNQAPDPDELDDPNNQLFASCDEGGCSHADLERFGYRNKQGDIPPVIPVINLILSARVIIKDQIGITLNGGFNTGFYFGGSLTYFFGKDFQTR